ncbi:WD40/YVTN repeat-like-containing domain [Ostreococcus tauri]|uniref:RING-type E3 ubiquitin transferase n=1 Tax=Ostreococcus tauri TaxID=70448 RepID=Q012I1_OSTTA|nr:WD40/YVTN repeat-like-containing domain [Ostreococcus tauri]CAL55199.1 WD40/YVTN repeat-like-containing domain [Ostreococcus tauri]|eukprot:XP_003081030.1 WD40/YVTN repeat-like-containing domain [Ostreococcus tauri]
MSDPSEVVPDVQEPMTTNARENRREDSDSGGSRAAYVDANDDGFRDADSEFSGQNRNDDEDNCEMDYDGTTTEIREGMLSGMESDAREELTPIAAKEDIEMEKKEGEPGGMIASGIALEIPAHFQCPITMELMQDPVMIATGHTYDRPAIQRWLDQGHRTCPVTGVRLRHLELIPNHAIRTAIQSWAPAELSALRPLAPLHDKAVVDIHRQNSDIIGLRDALGAGAAVVAPAANADASDDQHPVYTIAEGHDEIVWGVDTTPTTLFSASADKTIRAWDISSRRCVQVLEEHTRPVLCLAVCVKHDKLFSGSYDCTVRVWNLSTYRRITYLPGHTDAVRALQVYNDTTLYTASYDHTIRAYDIESLELLKVLRGHNGPVRTLVTVNDYVFSGSYDRTVRVWPAYSEDIGPSAGTDLVKTLKGHKDAVRALACFPRRQATSSNRAIGPYVFSGSDDSNVRVWNAGTFECIQELKGHTDNVRVLTVDDRYLYSGSWDKTIRVWDLETFSCKHIINGHTEAVLALCVMGGHLVSGSYDTTVRLWGVQSETEFECVGVFHAHNDAVRVLTSAGRNAATVFSGSYDGSIGFWRLPISDPRDWPPSRSHALGWVGQRSPH